MGNVRLIETKLGGLEDRILGKLGYREYSITIGSTALDPKPQVKEVPLSGYNETQLRGFSDKLGGYGNPITTFKVEVSRLISESLLRGFSYWTITRDSYIAQCLPVDFKTKDARIDITLAVVKVVASDVTLFPETFWDTSIIWDTSKLWGTL